MDVEQIYRELMHNDTYWVKNPGQRPEVQREVLRQALSVDAETILDAGCGRGHLANFLSKNGMKVTGCDLADASEYYKPFFKCCLTDMPFEDKQFDMVVCVDVIEHLYESDIDQAIRELLRVGKYLFFRAATYESKFGKYKRLHLTVHDSEWWCAKLWENTKIILKSGGSGKRSYWALAEGLRDEHTPVQK